MMESATPYDDVNIILHRLLHDVKTILGSQFIGMYLFGSLASGGFDKHSDIDILIVTQDVITEPAFSTLDSIHRQIAALDSPWATQLEVSYIPLKALRRFDPADKTHPRLDRGKGEVLHMMDHESDWIIQRHNLYTRGITLEGPGPQTLIDPVSPDDLRRGVVNVLPFWIDPIQENPSQYLKNRGYQSFIVLSLCRMLYTVQHGAVLPKHDAADWAKKELGQEWIPLIERAVIGRQNPDLEARPEDIDETLRFIHFVKSKAKKDSRELMITYRAYEDNDWKAICQIHDRARPDELLGSCDPRGFIPIEQDKEVEDLRRSKKFVACDDEKVVGFVGVDGDYLAWLYIDPDHYGKGIGRELLRMGIREIGEGAWTVVLDGNKRAIALYESEGFQEIGRFDGDNNGYPCTCLKMKRVS